MNRINTILVMIVAAAGMATSSAHSQTATTFTYQGELADNGTLANGPYDFDFRLYDALNGGVQVGPTITYLGFAVTDGRFTVTLDFGAAAFDNSARWLEIDVAGQTLTPRQPITRTPYAMQVNGMTIDADNNVLFDSLNAVEGTVTVSSPGGIDLILDADTNNSGEDQNARMVLRQDGGQVVGRLGYREGLNDLEIMQEYAGSLVLGTNSTDRMWINSGGFVGVGRAGAVSVNEVFGIYSDAGPDAYGGMYVETASQSALPFYGYAAGGNSDMWHYYDGGTDKWHLYNGGNRLTVDGAGNTGINTNFPAGRLHINGTGATYGLYLTTSENDATSAGIALNHDTDTWLIRNFPGSFGIGRSGTGFLHTLIIEDNGQTGIGTISPSYLLEVNGSAGKPGGGSWSNSSDARLKKNIAPIRDALDQLLALRGVTFEYKDPESISELPGERIGMIAQDVETVVPDWVEEREDGYKSVTYRGFEALTVEALRQLTVRQDNAIATLRAEKDAEIDQLRTRLEQMEKVMARLDATGANQ